MKRRGRTDCHTYKPSSSKGIIRLILLDVLTRLKNVRQQRGNSGGRHVRDDNRQGGIEQADDGRRNALKIETRGERYLIGHDVVIDDLTDTLDFLINRGQRTVSLVL